MTAEITWIIVALAGLAILIILAARFFERSTREVALVKTGIGGRKVVMDGGTIVIPYFQDVFRVNMQALRLEVSRTGEGALITNDRMRVDIGAAFYLSVIPSKEGIARAAQTLGNRTFHQEKLGELVEGKLVDALRSMAAKFTMDELHENRAGFVAQVKESLEDSLSRNGLGLDSVSLTALDQTSFTSLDENNALTAAGMRKLAEVISKYKKERAEIDGDAEVAVRKAAMEATKRKLKIELEEKEAEIAQVQQIETLKAAQIAEVVKRKAESELESARARIRMEQEIQAAEIAREQKMEIANQERKIAIANKSHEESNARAEADAVRAAAAKEEEAIITVRQVAEAGRRKQIQIEEAKAEAESMEIRSAARKKELLAEAEGQHAVIDAENKMKEHIVSMRVALAKLEAMPNLVSELVKPTEKIAEKIGSIDIHHVSGLGSGRYSGSSDSGAKSAINHLLDSIVDMAVQLPALKKIGEDIGSTIRESQGESSRKDPAEDKKE